MCIYFKAAIMRTINVCAGIGDNLWVLQKLMNSGEKFHFKIAGDEPKRGHQIFELFPQVVESWSYTDEFGSAVVCSGDRAKKVEELVAEIDRTYMKEHNPIFKGIKDQRMYLSMNHHLERGERIERWLPDLETTFFPEYHTTAEQKRRAATLIGKKQELVIGLYGSCYSVLRSWGFWHAPQWLELALNISKIVDCEVRFMVIGASFDIDLAKDLMDLLKKNNLTFSEVIGEDLGTVVEIMKKLNYFYSFPSGLGIISTSLRCPTMFFYPPHLRPMHKAWCSPESLKDETYVPMEFVTCKQAWDATPKHFLT